MSETPEEKIKDYRRRLVTFSKSNNTEELESTLSQIASEPNRPSPSSLPPDASYAPYILNTAKDFKGVPILHIAALNGNGEIVDILLDQEGLEIDQVEPEKGDTALHCAIRAVNEMPPEHWEGEGLELVDLFLSAGCDPRTRNRMKERPVDIVDQRNTELKKVLQKAEFTFLVSDDVVVEDDDDGPTGSGSESD
ncbi:hypothetical protein K402DRAFT_395004 [Aulographum hederae CBS 113979]|uniref:Uncharacterized protein n=1 Tax=Aulographum hederae CBS 113979 TaxID=1176131 RepID=A0A6G1GX13_9PEZI|nr:hypothetical protein K402DRAFT_395004 [Aulographum hederae CBS 113979]